MKKFILPILILLSSFNLISQSLTPTAKLALLTGVVTNFKGKALANEIIMFSNDKTKSLTKVNTNAAGKFEVLIPIGATYSLKYKNFTTDMDYTKMVVPATADATYNVAIKIDPPKDFVLKDVFFDTGKSVLKPTSDKALNDLVEILKIKNTMVVEIQGHTDNVGDEASNLKLSQARAEAVVKFLVAKGIKQERVSAAGYGSLMPIADNNSEDGKSKNRRTSLKVIKE